MALLPQRWPWKERPAADLPQEIIRYLADNEIKALGGQVHESRMIEPVASVIFGLIALVLIDTHLPSGAALFGDILIIGWLILLLRLGEMWYEWNHNLIFITPYRIIYVRGLVTRRVAMMPIGKVTDMSYNRTPLGMLLNYGEFVIESAGQDQALREIDRVPDPDATYRYMQNLLFNKSTTNVALVDVLTEKKVAVSYTGRFRKDPKGTGGTISDKNDKRPWPF